MDLDSYGRWYDYSRARDAMFAATDTETAPWYVANSNDKRRARLNIISHILDLVPYEREERARRGPAAPPEEGRLPGAACASARGADAVLSGAPRRHFVRLRARARRRRSTTRTQRDCRRSAVSMFPSGTSMRRRLAGQSHGHDFSQCVPVDATVRDGCRSSWPSAVPGLLFGRIVGSRRRHEVAEQHRSMGGTMDEGPSGIAKWIPGLRTARTYDRRWTRSDVVAGVVLAAILVPQGLAYAELAGLPPVTGLYTSIGCLVGYAVFGPSKILVLGPDSSISPLIFAALVPLLAGGDEHRAIALAGMLAVIVALIEIGLGIGRLGFVADLLSSEVQVGYMNGLALIIIVGQLPKLFGFSTDAEGFGPEIKAFVLGIDGTVGAALLVGVGGVGHLVGAVSVHQGRARGARRYRGRNRLLCDLRPACARGRDRWDASPGRANAFGPLDEVV